MDQFKNAIKLALFHAIEEETLRDSLFRGYTAIRDNDTDNALELKQKFDLDLKFALFDAIKEDEEVAIAMIENSQRLTLSLSETDGEERTPLILAGDLKKPKIVKAILCQACKFVAFSYYKYALELLWLLFWLLTLLDFRRPIEGK